MYSLRCQIHASLTRHFKYALFWLLCANVVLFIKPEIHNISQRLGLHRKTGSRPCLTCTKYLVKLGRVVLEICSQTGTQIHDTHYNTLLLVSSSTLSLPRTTEVALNKKTKTKVDVTQTMRLGW